MEFSVPPLARSTELPMPKEPYKPIRSEIQGIVKMLFGISALSVIGCITVKEILTGKREISYRVTSNVPGCFVKVGVDLIKEGVKEALPGIAVVAATTAAVYVGVSTLTTQETISEEPLQISFIKQIYG